MAAEKKEVIKHKSKKITPTQTSNRVLVFIIFVFTFIIYGNTLGNDYAVDDLVAIEQNHFVQKGIAGFKDILTTDSFDGFIKDQNNVVSGGRYRPFSLLTFAIEISFFGSNKPGISHFINLLLYALTGVLIFMFLKQLLIDIETKYSLLIHLPFITALLFIAHPIHTEAVANIKGRDEILAMLFSLLSAVFFLKTVDGKNNIKNYLFGFLFLFLGMLSKENAITFCAIIPLAIWFFRKINLKTVTPVLISIAAATGLFLVLRQAFVNTSLNADITELMNNPFYGMSLSQKYATIIFTFGKYFLLLLFPYTLSNNYYPKEITAHNFTDIETIVSIALCVTALVIASIGLRKKTLLSFSIFFFAITFSIVSNLFFPVGTFMSERFLFMPSLAFSLLTAFFIIQIPFLKFNKFRLVKTEMPAVTINNNFFRSRYIQFVLIIVLGAYSIRTIIRNRDWKDDFTLFSADVFNAPNSVRSHYALGGLFKQLSEKSLVTSEKNKNLELARNEFKKSIEIYPAFAMGYYDLGGVYFNLKKIDSAILVFKKSLSLDSANAVAWDNLGRCYIQNEKLDSAIWFCNKAVKLDSAYYQPFADLGSIYLKKMDIEKGYYYFQKAHSLNPNDKSINDVLLELNSLFQPKK